MALHPSPSISPLLPYLLVDLLAPPWGIFLTLNNSARGKISPLGKHFNFLGLSYRFVSLAHFFLPSWPKVKVFPHQGRQHPLTPASFQPFSAIFGHFLARSRFRF